MFKLNDKLREQISHEGKEYPVDLSFDNVLDVLDVWNDGSFEPEEKLIASCSLLFGEDILRLVSIDDLIVLFEQIKEEIFSEYEPVETYDLLGNPMKRKSVKADFSLSFDAEYIFTSFVQCYGINLQKELGKLHWDEFRMLLRDLPPEAKLNKVREIRNWKPDKNSTAEEIENMHELQEIYALPEEEGGSE
ncbi:Gp15 family bacteriophage protein [Lactococcus lactis]|uniref:Gp15 family bacteriophage protein n=1 Tax=Lactococcus lactis TaxID=1358 RepID=A0AAE4SX13_9LACT|nr:Gp15 family bacteriophage protein [Lactococcus lactis]MDV2633188.1 Gp15 family bacteriophage protein [Lactococcus lactis]